MLVNGPMSAPSFNGIYELSIPKAAFEEPDNIDACENQVYLKLCVGKKRSSLKELIKVIQGITSNADFVVNKNGTLVNIDNKEGMHTFSVLTGEEKDLYFDTFSPASLRRLRRVEMRNGRNPSAPELKAERLRQLRYKLEIRPSEKVEVKSLDELVEFAKKI